MVTSITQMLAMHTNVKVIDNRFISKVPQRGTKMCVKPIMRYSIIGGALLTTPVSILFVKVWQDFGKLVFGGSKLLWELGLVYPCCLKMGVSYWLIY